MVSCIGIKLKEWKVIYKWNDISLKLIKAKRGDYELIIANILPLVLQISFVTLVSIMKYKNKFDNIF